MRCCLTLCKTLKGDGCDNLSICCAKRGAASYNLALKIGFEEIYDYGNDVVSLNLPFEKIADRLAEV